MPNIQYKIGQKVKFYQPQSVINPVNFGIITKITKTYITIDNCHKIIPQLIIKIINQS